MKIPFPREAMLPALMCAALSCGVSADQAQTTADAIYRGGHILTINDAQPRAQAVAVRDGKILAVGSEASVMALRGKSTALVDLAGRALLPGFVDSHGHVGLGGMQAMSANMLAPPDGNVRDIASLQRELGDWIAANPGNIEMMGWVIGFGYDNAQLAELRHPTRQDLDKVSTDIPIVIIHQSGHLGVANSAALEIAGITRESEAPAGGVIRRDAQGEPNGVLEEYAFFQVLMPLIGGLGAEGQEAFVKAGSKQWARYGYTTAQEGRASAAVVEALKSVGAAGELPVDVVAYPDVLLARDYIEANVSDDYLNRVRVGGCKLTIDGSPQGFTALRDRPYYDPVGDYPRGYKGYAAVTVEQVQDSVNWCYGNNIQIITHANGEGASDMLIAALADAEDQYGDNGTRPVLIHGQFLREDQVDSYQQLGVFPSLFPMHTFYWGDWHRDHTVGPVNGENISPTGWVHERGMKFGTHHDAPVALPNSMRILSATVTRRTRSGDILGPHQRVDVMTALKAMTIWPAWQHHEEDLKGSIEVGKLADFVVLSDDPTRVDPATLAELEVEMTIKEGRVIFSADDLENASNKPSANALFMSDHEQAHKLVALFYGSGAAGQ